MTNWVREPLMPVEAIVSDEPTLATVASTAFPFAALRRRLSAGFSRSAWR